MDYLSYILYVVSATAPSIIWLFFYLSKDSHPEPKKAILKVFFRGVIAATLVYILSLLIFQVVAIFFPNLALESMWFIIFRYFITVALIEELSKYLVARNFITSSSEIDEPLDVMLYLTVSALGFAALENLLLIFTTVAPVGVTAILDFSFLRLIGATFLHTLASGVLGFFLALSFYYHKNRKQIFLVGLCIAVFAHGLYDFSIIEFSGQKQIFFQSLILISLAIFTTWGFFKLKRIRSVSLVG